MLSLAMLSCVEGAEGKGGGGVIQFKKLTTVRKAQAKKQYKVIKTTKTDKSQRHKQK